MTTRRQLEEEIDTALAPDIGPRAAQGVAPRSRPRPTRAGGRTRCSNPACPNRTQATAGYCQGCKSRRHHAYRRIAGEGLLVDSVGGAWWIWDASGNVLVTGRDTRANAIDALAFGEDADEDDG